MARPLRVEFPGALYHVTSRGNAGQEMFLDDKDRLAFLDILAEVVERYRFICYASASWGTTLKGPRGQPFPGDAPAERGLYPEVQPQTQEIRAHLPGAVQGHLR